MKNRTSWAPGASRNPKGRPPDPDGLTDLLKLKAKRKKAAIVDALIQMATKGRSESNRLAAAKLILAYLEGAPSQKPPQKQDNKLEVIFGDDKAA